MLEWFRCPDGKLMTIKDCLKCVGSCRHGETCLSQPTRYEISREREWSGKPSTTQLLNGTMLEFLKLTKPYAIDPDGMMFALLGTRHHQQLEVSAKTLGLPSEVALTGGDRDIIDLLEPDGVGGYILTDMKTWGSYRVAKALGIVAGGKVPDPSGELYKASGAWGKAGTPKMVNRFIVDKSKAENIEAELQLNHYRLLFEEKFHLTISKMRLQVVVRDGGLQVANGRGITRNSYIIPIAKMDDDKVRSYFHNKEVDLLQALSQGSWDTPCSNFECWDGNRCREYCDVWQFCPKGIIERGDKP